MVLGVIINVSEVRGKRLLALGRLRCVLCECVRPQCR